MAFRDTVLLKTEVYEALEMTPPPTISPGVRQMCLVLQSVHKNPPTEQFFTLQAIVLRVVSPYLVMVARPKLLVKAPSETHDDGELLYTQLNVHFKPPSPLQNRCFAQ